MDNSLFWIFVIIVVVAGLFIKTKENSPRKARKYSYNRRQHIMTKVEREFYKKLNQTVGDRYYVFPQVHLSALLDHKVRGQNWLGAFSHINQKSVDYVVCDKDNFSPLVAIELDDYTHGSETRKQRDEDVGQMLSNAGLPLLRFPNQDVNPQEISSMIDETLLNARVKQS